MDLAPLISTGNAIAVSVIGSVVTVFVVGKRNDRKRAQLLLTEVEKNILVLKQEMKAFYQLTASPWAKLVTISHLAIGTMASWREQGRWMSGAAEEARYWRDWNYQASKSLISSNAIAKGNITSALTQLIFLDKSLGEPASALADDVMRYSSTRNSANMATADETIDLDFRELTAAIQLYLKKRWWKRGPFAVKPNVAKT